MHFEDGATETIEDDWHDEPQLKDRPWRGKTEFQIDEEPFPWETSNEPQIERERRHKKPKMSARAA